jgi:hypothetical protein
MKGLERAPGIFNHILRQYYLDLVIEFNLSFEVILNTLIKASTDID